VLPPPAWVQPLWLIPPSTTPERLCAIWQETALTSFLNNTALGQGLAALRPHGTLVSVAGWGDLARVDMGLAMVKEIDIRFSMTYEPSIDYPATLSMLASGAFNADVLISDHIPLERLIEDGLEELLHHADNHVKILVDPS
jgi:(R,R)-butanediol dehydrogenase / meso-butanediol dehydrogenase / diacetyl reductase